MLIKARRFFIFVSEIHAYENEIASFLSFKLNEYRNACVSGRSFGYIKLPHPTLMVDLTGEEDGIFAKFNPTTRNEVRGAEKAGVACVEGRLQDFVPYFNDFARAKGLPTVNLAYYDWMGEDCIVTQAELDGEVYAMHAYFLNRADGVARLFQSASHFRDGKDAKLTSRANRLLHWRDMLMFKHMGIARYDFGGISPEGSAPSLMAITKFKRGFGGADEDQAEYVHAALYAMVKVKGVLAGLRTR
jgi:hypothetical protein